MHLHETGSKGFQLFAPHTAFNFGGIEFTDGVGIMPQKGKSALHFIRTLTHIYRSSHMGNALRELENWITEYCPESYLLRSDEDWRRTYTANNSSPSDASGNLGGGGRNCALAQLSSSVGSKENYSSTPSYSNNTVGMDQRGHQDTADFGSFTGCVAFSGLKDVVRGEIFSRLNSDPTLLNAMYLRQKSSDEIVIKSKNGQILRQRHPFWDFIEELNARFILFNSNAPDCLTYGVRAPLPCNPSNRDYRCMYREELYTINNDLPEIFKYCLSKKYRDGLEIKRPKIQQYLRGFCHLRMLEICYGKIPNVSPTIVKSIGTLVFPMGELGYLRTAIDCWRINILTTTQFQRTIQSIRERMKNQDAIPINGIVSEITGVPYTDIDRLLWAFRNSGGQNGKA